MCVRGVQCSAVWYVQVNAAVSHTGTIKNFAATANVTNGRRLARLTELTHNRPTVTCLVVQYCRDRATRDDLQYVYLCM